VGNVLCESNDFLSLRQAGLSSGEGQLAALDPDKSCGNYKQEADRMTIGHWACILQHACNIHEFNYKIHMLAAKKFRSTKS
jgi:hypothetical protein